MFDHAELKETNLTGIEGVAKPPAHDDQGGRR